MRLLEQTARTEGGNRPSGFIFKKQMRDTCFNLRDSLLAQKSELSSCRIRTRFSFSFSFFSLSLSLGFTIHCLLQTSTSLISLYTHLLSIWTPDSDSPRRRALGRTLRFKLRRGWFFGLLQNQTQNHLSSILYLEGSNPLTLPMFLKFNSSMSSYF